MLEYFKSSQSSTSILLSIIFNIAMILYVLKSIQLEGKKYIVFKIIFLVFLVMSTLTLFISL